MIAWTVHDGNMYFIAETKEFGPVAEHIKFKDDHFCVSVNKEVGGGGEASINGEIEFVELVSLEEFNKRMLNGESR